MDIITVRDLTVSRGGHTILHTVNASVQKGETLVIIGPSGGGKSTFLRCLNRLEEPESGAILLDGTDITQLPVVELRRRVGMIFQKTAPFDGTIGENIAYGPALNNQRLSHERIRELMELASLDPELMDTDASALSGGQEQRLAIARALANQPEVLLLDEPTSALDPIATRHIEESLMALKKQLGLTMIWVSHAIEQARRVGDRVMLLDAGRVIRIDSTDVMLHPQNGDKRALAFAEGDESGLHPGQS